MKRPFPHIFYFFLTFIVIGTLFSCKSTALITTTNDNINIFPIAKKGLWGYADESGEVIIDYKYDEAQFFSGGLAGVKQGDKYGYINKLGDYKIKPKYDSVTGFGFRKAQVFKNGKSFIIDKTGKKLKNEYILKMTCGGSFEVSDPLDYFVKVGDQYQLNEIEFEKHRYGQLVEFNIEDFTYDELIPITSKSVVVRRGIKYAIFMHYSGVGIKHSWVDDIHPIYDISNGDGKLYEAHKATFRVGDRWGLMTGDGKVLIGPEFLSINHVIGEIYLVEYRPDHWGHVTQSKRYYRDDIE